MAVLLHHCRCTQVVLADIDVTTLVSVVSGLVAEGAEAIGVKCDVTAREDVEAMVQRAVDWAGTVDILVANAGTCGGLGLRGDGWSSTTAACPH
jgi:NAD(P)-dependent dehydrogenase (short-subunit alcohol dehydrogenase family)